LIAFCVPAVRISEVATTLISIKEKMAITRAAPRSEAGGYFVFSIVTLTNIPIGLVSPD
jgi:hypothetical protein